MVLFAVACLLAICVGGHGPEAALMLEQGIPPENVIGALGRVSQNMLEAYNHTGLRAKREALGMARGNIIAFPSI
jgi:hypothetical protein